MKRVTFDLTGFSDNEDEVAFEIRAPSPRPEEIEEEEEEDLTIFESDEEN